MRQIQQLGQGTVRARIAVVGCGGAGCNTVHHLPPAPDLELIGLNDVPHQSLLGIKHKVLISEQELNTIATLDDSLVKSMETDAERLIARELIGYDFVVAVAGLGGNTGGDGANAVIRVAKLHNIPAWAITTMPFKAEGFHRKEAARESLERLKKRCPSVLTFANDQLLEVAPDIPIRRAFSVMGQIMVKPIEVLSRIMTKEDVRTLKEFLGRSKELRLGIGEASGEHRTFAAVQEALSSPWMKFDVESARNIVVFFSAAEVNEKLTKDVLHDISLRAPIADLLWGVYAEGQGEKVRVSVLVPLP